MRDNCLNNAEEVAEDSKTTDANMVKTVPYSIAIPRNDEVRTFLLSNLNLAHLINIYIMYIYTYNDIVGTYLYSGYLLI